MKIISIVSERLGVYESLTVYLTVTCSLVNTILGIHTRPFYTIAVKNLFTTSKLKRIETKC